MSFINTLDQLDRSIFLKLNGWNTAAMDPVMWYISEPLTWIPMYGFFLVLASQKFGKKGVIGLLIGLGIVVLLADNIHRELFKEVFERLRPSRNPELANLVHLVTNPKSGNPYTGGMYGFISGHASNFTGIGTFILLFIQPKPLIKFIILLWVILICYSRIYLGVHYPGDILGGVCLGASIGYFSNYLVQRFIMKKSTS